MVTVLEAKPETAALDNDEILRYSRHLIMPEVGMEGQQKLKAARVLCIGAGGLGPLWRCTWGRQGGNARFVDFDVVDYTNLQRQIITSTADVGRKKLDSAADEPQGDQSLSEHQKFDTRLSSENALEIFKDFDIIADGTDNFPTRYLVNDACVLTGKPNVYGSISASRARPASSPRRKAPATAACTPSRHRLDWFHRAPRAACWAFCPVSLASSRPRKPSS